MAELQIAAGSTAVLIAGPTASGKSRLALDLARTLDGAIVNADSMQVYGELRILTARPPPADMASVPHLLYGHVPAADRYSVGRWLDAIAGVLGAVREEGRLPILVGGTGLYFKALTEGLAAVPPIPVEVRQAVLQNTEGEGSEILHRQLADIDPEDAAQIRPSDRSRILRAMEVFEATGRSLAAWRARPAAPVLDRSTVECLILDPDRALLHERIASRAEAMIHEGAMAEVEALAKLRLSPDLPAMKAIGVRELLGHLRGDLSLEEALAGTKTETRRYAKRQMTWFRNQMAGWRRWPA
jgi:tRNA dimethylallyltransferase